MIESTEKETQLLNEIEYEMKQTLLRIANAINVERLEEGKKYWLSKGYYMSSIVPFGYRRDYNNKNDKKLVIDEVTAPIVQLIFEMYADGSSIKKIAECLTLNEISTPMNHLKQANQASKWNKSSVNGILKNRFYIGYIETGKTKKINGRRIKIPQVNWMRVQGTHEALISEDMFDRVQLQIRIKAING